MNLDIGEEQASELRAVLDEVLGDISSEIADTDNSEYRVILRGRRDRIREIRDQLGAA
ncbi:MAG TPA: hypothetical protein VMU76_09010 [Acidimicrobiales bacterium]|nr:hypothetical protein [Acidimicrobiales bacterium]